MKSLLLIVISSFALAKRLLFWLAIVQQKEYRLDRFKLFLTTEEGRSELWSLLPSRSWLKVKLWKRPHWTARLIVLVTSWIFLVFVILLIFWWLPSLWWIVPLWLNIITILLWMCLIYIATPWLILICLCPTTIISILTTSYYSSQAKKIVSHFHPLVIGITGSYGKTSTKQLLAHVLATKYSVFSTPKSFNTRYSVVKSIVDSYKGEEIMIVEYGAYKKGEIENLCQIIPPQLAVITGITVQHLGIFGSLESIINAKSELVSALPPSGVVFYNAVDGQTKNVASAFTGIKYGYGSVDERHIQSAGVTDRGQLEFVLDGVVVKTQLIGLHYLTTIEAVLMIGEHLGVPRSQILARLMSFQPTTNFTHIHSLKNHSTLLDDGQTSNPIGFQAMLDLARSLNGQPKVLVFGGIVDLGDKSSQIHTQLAQLSADIFDQVWYVSQQGLVDFSQIKTDWVLHDRDLIITQLKNLSPGTLLAVEGKIPTWLSNLVDQYKG